MKAPRWGIAPVAAGLVLVLLLGAVGAGLRIPGLTYLSGLPGLGLLDYRTLSAGSFLPLRAGYVDGLLGTKLDADRAAPAALGESLAEPAGLRAIAPFTPATDEVQPTRPGAAVPDHPFTNDDMASPVVIAALPFTARTDTRNASREPGEPDSCAPRGGTAWYSYTARRDSTLLADTIGSDHPTAIGVFTSRSGLRQVGCATGPAGNAQLSFAASKGQRYLFQVAGLVAGGELTFHLSAIGRTNIASAPADGRTPAEHAARGHVSGDGRFVAYTSRLLPICQRGLECPGQVFVLDRRTGRSTLVSRHSAGATGNGNSFLPTLSHDGRYVGFTSRASNLVDGDSNNTQDYFVHDRDTGETVRASVSSQGRQGSMGVFGHDGLGGSLSPDGRFASFWTAMTGLVDDDPPGTEDVFVHDLRAGITTLESTNDAGERGIGSSDYNRVSRDGRFVVFLSTARNLAEARYGACPRSSCPNVFVRDRRTGTTRIVSVDPAGNADMGADKVSISADGAVIAWTTTSALGDDRDTNGVSDVFVVDLRGAGVPRRVSLSSTGEQQNDPSSELVRSARHDDHTAAYVSVSGDGRRVVFDSRATNLVLGDSNGTKDIFLRDLVSGTTTRVSTNSHGEQANGESADPALSYDGRVITFQSTADDLVQEDSNGVPDVFVHDLSGF